MDSRSSVLRRLPFYLTAGSVVSILFSIAVSQILLALALIAVLFSHEHLRFPPIKLPLALFCLGTAISLFLSGDPRTGTPQIRKFFIFLVLLLVPSTFKSLSDVRHVVLLWVAVAALSALRSLAQFAFKYQDAAAHHQDFYKSYVGGRITGFMSHWMTFGGEEMVVMLMLGAFLFFAPHSRWKSAGWIAGLILSVSMVLGLTRGIWLGVAAAGLYLVWFWNRRVILAVPVLVALLLVYAPVRERIASAFHPHGDTDSNQFRVVVWRTGLRMIRAHPWFGLGPEQVKVQLPLYIPDDIPRPLPTGWYGHLHSIYIQYAAERGIPTMAAMMWLLGKMLYDFSRALRRASPDSRWVFHGAIAVLIGILVAGLSEYNLGDSEVLTMFLSAAGMGYVVLLRNAGVVREAQRTPLKPERSYGMER